MAIKDIPRGSTKRWKFTFTDLLGVVINITGWKLYFTVKASINDLDVAALIQVNTTAGDDGDDDVLNGVMHLKVTSAETDVLEDLYHYDFTRVIPGGTPDVKVLEVDTVSITKRATIQAV